MKFSKRSKIENKYVILTRELAASVHCS